MKCVYVRTDLYMKLHTELGRLWENILNVEYMFECIWVKIITKNYVFNVATIYHPPRDCGYKNKDLTDYLIDSCDPNMKIIIARDINKVNIEELLSQQSLIQMVKTPTRCNNIFEKSTSDKRSIKV